MVVDAMSKWLEVFNMTSTSATYLIERLNELFSRFGIPRQIVSDNGAQFTSNEFEYFNKYYGIEHIFTAPYHPSSNGLAENAVKTVKRVIKKAIQEKQNINKALWSFLLYYRNVEHSTTGECPAMLLLGRRLRTRLDQLKPDREGHVRRVQQRQQEAAAGASRGLGRTDQVWYRQYLKGEKWIPGQIVEVVGSCNYKIRGADGDIVHRHIDQLRKRPSEGRLSLASATPRLSRQADVADPQGSEPGCVGLDGDESEGSTGAREPRASEPPASPLPPAPASPGGRQCTSPVTRFRVQPVRQCRLNRPK